MVKKLQLTFLIYFCIIFLAMCTADASPRGKRIYETNCIGCHNVNPRKVGSIAPDVWGSSEDLLRLKVLNGTYPKGYKPKRNTKIMPLFPQLRNEIKVLRDYLNEKN